MPTEVGKAYVTLIPSARGFASKMQSELAGDVTRAGDAGGAQYGEKFSKSASGKVSGRGKTMFAGLAKAGAVAAVAAGAVVGKALVESVTAASDYSETVSKATQLFGAAAIPALEKYASTAADTMGQSKQQALDAAATFSIFGKAAGLQGKPLADFSTGFTTLSSDLASFHNASPQEAIDAIGAALRGESEPIRRFGVMLDEATLKAEAMSLGLLKPTKDAPKIRAAQVAVAEGQKKYQEAVKKSGKDSLEAQKADAALGTARGRLAKATEGSIGPLTSAQKTMAAQSAIMKQTKDAQGDFTKTSGGLANQQRILAARFANAKGELGKGLLPVALKLMTWANKMVPIATDLGKKIGATLGPAFKKVGEYLTPAVDAVKLFIDSLSGKGGDKMVPPGAKGIIDFATRVKQVFGIVMSFIRTQLVPAFMGIVTAVRGYLRVVIPIVQQFVNGMMARIRPFMPQIKAIFSMVGQIIVDTMTLIRVWIERATTAIQFIWNRWGSNIMDFIAKIFGRIIKIIGGALKVIQGVIRTVTAILKGDWSGAWDGIKQIVSGAWDIIKNTIGGALEAIGGIIRGAGTLLFTAMEWVGEQLRDGINGALSDLGGFGMDLVNGLIDGITGTGRKLYEAVTTWVSENVPDPIKKLLDIASPSKLMAQFGRFTGQGFVKGLVGTSGSLNKTVKGMVGQVTDGFAGISAGPSSAMRTLAASRVTAAALAAPAVSTTTRGTTTTTANDQRIVINGDVRAADVSDFEAQMFQRRRFTRLAGRTA